MEFSVLVYCAPSGSISETERTAGSQPTRFHFAPDDPQHSRPFSSARPTFDLFVIIMRINASLER